MKPYQLYSVEQKDKQYVLLDGERKVLCTYDFIGKFINGIALIRKGCYYSAINDAGERILPFYRGFKITNDGYTFIE